VWAEIRVDNEHLRLFSEHNAQGVQVSVYNVNTKSWIAPSEPVDDTEQGKERAAEYARAYLKHVANSELPSVGLEAVPLAVAKTISALCQGFFTNQLALSNKVIPAATAIPP
jgi:hypothetical protein